MKTTHLLAFASLLAAPVFAQNDAPPEMNSPLAPSEIHPQPTPRPQLHGNVQLQFQGNTAFTERQLRAGIVRQIETIDQYGLDEPNAYDAGFFLESFYRKQGYSQVEVTARITGPWQLLLTIDEGPLTRIGTVTVHGNEAFDTATLDKYLLGPIRERYPRIREVTRLPYVDSDIRSGVGLVTRLYATEGYLDAVVDQPEITFNSDDTVADITLTVHEGIQYTFGQTEFVGPLIFPQEQLLAEVQAETKNIYTPGRLAAAQRKLEDFYKARGYYQAEVSAVGDVLTAVDGKVPVTFTIAPGALFHFDGVTVSGNSGVRTTFIQKRMQRLHGQVYDPTLIDRQFRQLIDTGLFRTVRINPKPIPGDQLELEVNVEEAKPKEFGVGLGYASFDGGIVNFAYSDRNIFGTGRPLTIEAEITQRGYSGDITYEDPWWFDSDYALKLRVYALTRELKGYSKNEFGFNPSISRKFTDHWEVSAFVLAKQVKLKDILIDPPSLTGPQNYSAVSIGLSQTLDYRNNVTLPTRGFIFTTAVDFAPNELSSLSFIRGVARFTYYLPITARSSLALGARGGVIAPLNGTTLPIDERFFNGGATTVRSFSELTLGPKDSVGYPIGGQAFTVFNAEYSFPLFGDLYGAVFVDAGNVLEKAGDFGLEDMRYAVGAGLRYNLPIGAIRLDYGLNPSPRQGEAQGAFHFAIGVAF